jgi:hypothetical protein
MGVLLWVRRGNLNRFTPVEQAFKAADILLQNGSFVIASDLGDVKEELIRKSHYHLVPLCPRDGKNTDGFGLFDVSSRISELCSLDCTHRASGAIWVRQGLRPTARYFVI